jgi:hypothetical protein
VRTLEKMDGNIGRIIEKGKDIIVMIAERKH